MWQGSSDHTSNGQGSAEGKPPLSLPLKEGKGAVVGKVICDGAREGEEVKHSRIYPASFF